MKKLYRYSLQNSLIFLIFMAFSTLAWSQTDTETLYEDAVCVDTNAGEFCMELFPDLAPNTVANFLAYVNSGRYDDTIVHRTVPNFVIQGGGYSSAPLGNEVPRDSAVVNEFGLSNTRGTVAMARIGGQINSATSEWFVNVVNNTQLDSVDGGFTVFARIITGLDIVDAISDLPRVNLQSSLGNAFGEVPLTNQNSGGVATEDLVLVHRIYVTDVAVGGSDGGDGGSDGGDGGSDGGDGGSDGGDGGSDGGDGGSGGDDGIETTTTYGVATNTFTLPVRVKGILYRVIMRRDSQAAGAVFSVETTRIFSLVDIGQDAATMNLDEGTLYIPSIRVGNVIATDIEFDLIEFATLTFKLKSFTLP